MRINSTISFVLFNGIAGSLGSKINLPFLCKEYVLSNINKESALHRTKQKKEFRTHRFGIHGGRYKTRTCDLPHVKRMRYQLRQSSVFVSARGILLYFTLNVKPFFFFFPHRLFFLCAGRRCRLKTEQGGGVQIPRRPAVWRIAPLYFRNSRMVSFRRWTPSMSCSSVALE